MSRPAYVGIDLGTTNSAAAVFDGEQVVPVRTSDGGVLTPSVVRFDARGGVTVGGRARRYLDSDPKNTRSEFKRLMGSEHRLPFPALKAEKRPEELSAEVLRSIRQDLHEQLGFEVSRAVVTVPALFELPQTRATAEAARLAGYAHIEMLQEPVASAIAAGWRADDGEARPWLVYDLGGGTFDASLLLTQEGMLQVVGHDGDNFLGGRDLDAAIVAHVLRGLPGVDAADPVHALGMRKLRHAAEEAKITLSRQERTTISLPEVFVLDGAPLDVDVELTRGEVEALLAPFVDRSLTVCRRLLAAHGILPTDLGRVVLVGGPTQMPALRDRVSQGLGAPLATGLDPMTLVAQGAALFAATAGLDARTPVAAAPGSGARLWLQHPTMTADLEPWLVGRVTDGGPLDAVRARANGGPTAEAEVGPDGTFTLGLKLRARSTNELHLTGVRRGVEVPVQPASVTIVHGVSLQDPPLPRTIGVARADDSVQIFFPRGSPLPIKRRFPLTLVESLRAGDTEGTLVVPVVQGEFHHAHLCRLVGALEVPAAALKGDLRVGDNIEVELELDRGGRLSARATLPSGQTFDEVAQLVAPAVSPEAMIELASAIRVRLARARDQLPTLDGTLAAAAAEAEARLAEVNGLWRLARGGDADAAEKGRRSLIEADGAVATVEAAAAWPELAGQVQEALDFARGWVARYGTEGERRSLDDLERRVRQALHTRREGEVERLRGVIEGMGNATAMRAPGAWGRAFHWWRARAHEAHDGVRAQAIVARGEAAMRKSDDEGLQRACQELAELVPDRGEDRKKAFGSGVR